MAEALRPMLRDCPHPDDRLDPGRPVKRQRHVEVNVAHSSIGWLFARGLISERQRLAGEALARDYHRAGLSPGVTMRWDAAAGSGRGASSHDDAPARQIDARRRFHAAIDAAGPGLADLCWRGVCDGTGMAQCERALGWPARSGRIILGIALDRLADHYRLPRGG